MATRDWDEILESKYVNKDYYLLADVELLPYDIEIQNREDYNICSWCGSEYPYIFYVNIYYLPQTMQIVGFDYLRRIELSGGPRGYFEDRPVSNAAKSRFYYFMEQYATRDAKLALQSKQEVEEKRKKAQEENKKVKIASPAPPAVESNDASNADVSRTDSLFSSDPSMVLENIKIALQKGRLRQIEALVEGALEAGKTPTEIRDIALLPAMQYLNVLFKANEIFVPELAVSFKTYEKAMAILRPLMDPADSGSVGKVCITVPPSCTSHTNGKNLVILAMVGHNIEVVDLEDCEPEELIQGALENDCSIIAVSIPMTTGLSYARKLIALIESKGLRDRFKIMIGGVATTQEFCDEIGADVYTDDAFDAAEVAAELLKAKQSHD